MARPEQLIKMPNLGNKQAQLSNPRCWGKFWSTYTGKDKTARILQYSFRALSFYMRAHNPDSEFAATIQKVSKDVSKGRTVFRLFRWIDEYYKFVDALRSDYKGTLKLTACITTFVKGSFILMNNVYFLLTFKLAGPGTPFLVWLPTKERFKLISAYVRLIEIVTGQLTQLQLIKRYSAAYAKAHNSVLDAQTRSQAKVQGADSGAGVGLLPAEEEAGEEENRPLPSPRNANRRAAAAFKRRGAIFKLTVYSMNLITYGEVRITRRHSYLSPLLTLEVLDM